MRLCSVWVCVCAVFVFVQCVCLCSVCVRTLVVCSCMSTRVWCVRHGESAVRVCVYARARVCFPGRMALNAVATTSSFCPVTLASSKHTRDVHVIQGLQLLLS